jgi:hypothetical protein
MLLKRITLLTHALSSKLRIMEMEATADPTKKGNERADLFDQILSRLNPSRNKRGLSRDQTCSPGRLLLGIDTKDLYSLISKCDDAERRGYGTLGGAAYASLVGVLVPHTTALALAGVLALTVARSRARRRSVRAFGSPRSRP